MVQSLFLSLSFCSPHWAPGSAGWRRRVRCGSRPDEAWPAGPPSAPGAPGSCPSVRVPVEWGWCT
eukprot:12917718-Alexandrium_andersonii.AAC.1